MKYLLLALLVIPVITFADEETPDSAILTTETKKHPDDFSPRESHWVSTVGFESIHYELPFEFTGVHDTINKKSRELWGTRLGFGGEWYIGAGFATTSKIEGYYSGTLFEGKRSIDSSTSKNVAYTQNKGQLYGGDFVQSLSWFWEMKTANPFLGEMVKTTIEPFIEAGFGLARSFNQVAYYYNDGSFNEQYEHTVTDTLISRRIGAGFNITSSEGYFLYLKAISQDYDVTTRKEKVKTASASTDTTQKNVPFDPVTIFMVGGGVKF